MTKYGNWIALLVWTWCALVRPAQADPEAIDVQMQRLLGPYLRVQTLLASDSNRGVSREAGLIVREAKKLSSQATAKHAVRYRALSAELSSAAAELAKATSLEESRAAFKKLSRPMVDWARRAKPAGVSIVACPMVKGSWLQEGNDIRNPYAGQAMLSCGEVVSEGGTQGS